MEEYGIPVDHIGGMLSLPVLPINLIHRHEIGTSIGAFIGGLYAKEGDIISSAGRAKQFSGRMSNIWRMLSDVTYPIVAYTTVGHGILECIFDGSSLSYRATNSIGHYTRHFMIFISKICGFHISATQPTLPRREWRFMKQGTPGAIFVSGPSSMKNHLINET